MKTDLGSHMAIVALSAILIFICSPVERATLMEEMFSLSKVAEPFTPIWKHPVTTPAEHERAGNSCAKQPATATVVSRSSNGNVQDCAPSSSLYTINIEAFAAWTALAFSIKVQPPRSTKTAEPTGIAACNAVNATLHANCL